MSRPVECGVMQVGIVADTHDNMDVIGEAVEYFEGRVAVVVHCGDMVAPFAATPFDADFQFYAVRGNNDGEPALGNTVRINPGGIPTDVDGDEPPAAVVLDTETGETEWHDLG